jgi:2-dehydropantoate 2-reductase
MDERARRVGLLLAGEAVLIARRMGVRLVKKELFESEPEAFLSAPGSAAFQKLEDNYRTEYEPLQDLRGSMLQDLEKGRPTEVEHMSGFVVRKGEELGIATPANRTMLAVVKELERKEVRPTHALLERFSSLRRP